MTQQVCEVSLGTAGQIRTASGEARRGAVGHTTANRRLTSVEVGETSSLTPYTLHNGMYNTFIIDLY